MDARLGRLLQRPCILLLTIYRAIKWFWEEELYDLILGFKETTMAIVLRIDYEEKGAGMQGYQLQVSCIILGKEW